MTQFKVKGKKDILRMKQLIKKEVMKFANSRKEEDLELFIGLYANESIWLSMEANGWSSGASIGITRKELLKVRDMINRILE